MMINKILGSIAVISIIGLVVTSVGIAHQKSGLVSTTVVTFPSDAMISINGVMVADKQSIYLKPGTYVVEATRDGFAQKLGVISTFENSSIPTLLLLDATSGTGKKWVSEHQSEYNDFEQLSSDAASKKGDDLRSNYPILSKLPYTSYLFSIGYRINNLKADNHLEITINAPDVYIQNAIEQIREWGYNPADYDIVFTNTRNIFDD